MNYKLIVSVLFLAVIIGLSFFQETQNSETPTPTVEVPVEKVALTVSEFPIDCDWEDIDRVLDGDTIALTNKEKVRFIGINTPEVSGPYTEEQFFGREASAQMHSFLDDEHQVCLLTDSIGDKYDKYDRRLSYVYTEAGLNLNLEMIKGGFAKVYRKFDFDHKDEFLEIEQVARSRGMGLWE